MAAVPASPAEAQNFTEVSCDQVISESIVVTNDLEGCPNDGLVIGADGITVNLNGHSVAGRLGADGCEGACIGRHGIDTAGHDGLTIKNGTLSYFRRGVYMRDTDTSRLANLATGTGPYATEHMGILLLRSSGNALSNVTNTGGDPGIILWRSSLNTVEDSTADGGISIRTGRGLVLAAGSDYNRIVRTSINGNWTGLEIIDAAHNLIVGSRAAGYVENVLAGDDNTIVDSHLGYNKWAGVRIGGDGNTLRRNTIEGGDGIDLYGDRNIIADNDFPDTGFQAAILVGSGRGNQVTGNRIAVGPDQHTGNYGIHIFPAAFSTELTGNRVAHANLDGIYVEAAGTVVRNNTANDNPYIGINAVRGVIDAGGNRARGNGNPLQCVNVICR